NGRRDKLRQKLLERARRQFQEPVIDLRAVEMARLGTRRTELQAALSTIEYRMARERDDNLYAALARQHEAARTGLFELDTAIRKAEAMQPTTVTGGPEEQAEAALALLDDVLRIANDPAARADINPLLGRLGLRIGLAFRPIVKGKKRMVQRLASGRL